MKTKYVVGLLFNSGNHVKVLLQRKTHPEWQRNKLNGPGGHIEDGETPFQAMIREFKEEVGVEIDTWEEKVVVEGPDWIVHFFATSIPWAELAGLDAKGEDEKVWIYDVIDDGETLLMDALPNLRWIIPLCCDRSGVVFPVKVFDREKDKCQSGK